MLKRKHRSIRFIIGTVVVGGVALASAAPAQPVAGESGRAMVDRAGTLIDAGQYIRARDLLQTAMRPENGLSRDDFLHAYDLWQKVSTRLDRANPLEVSLQRAEMELDRSNLREGERHARAVADAPAATEAERSAANELLRRVHERRATIAPLIPGMIERAVAGFEAGRYAESKGELDLVVRSGAALTEDEQKLVARYQNRIVELEEARGEVFASGAEAGVMQPGVVRRRNQDQPADQPAEEPELLELPEQQPEEPAAQPEQPPAEQDVVDAALRVTAAGILAEADLAYENGRYNEAATKYMQLTTQYRDYLTPEQVAHSEEQLEKARLLLRDQSQIGDIEQEVQMRQMVKDETIAVFNNELAEADEALRAGDTVRARERAARAKLTLNNRRRYFSESEYQQLLGRAESKMTQIERTAEQIRSQMALEQQQRLAEQARKMEETVERERQAKIAEHIERVRALQREMKYDEALQVVDNILFLDPINPSGLLLRDLIRDLKIYTVYNSIQADKQWGYTDLTIENERASIPPAGIVNYPRDWPAISAKRGEPIEFAESPENKQVLGSLQSQSMPVEFADNSLNDVVNFLANATQLDFDVDWASLDEMGIGPETPVSLRLRNASVETILDRVMDKVSVDEFSKAGWAVRDGMVLVASDEDLRKDTVLVIYDIRDLLVEVPNYTDVPELDLNQATQGQGGRGGGGGGRSPFQENNRGQNQMNENVTTLDERTDTVLDLIQALVDPDGWEDNGGTTGAAYRLNGNLIITNTPRNHRAINGLLSQLRAVRAMQINVETRFLLVNQNFFEQLGFDLDVYFNAQNNQFRTANAADPTIQPSDFFDFSAAGFLLRDVQGAQNPPGTGAAQGVVNPAPWSMIGAGQDSLGLAAGLIPAEGIAANILSSAPALGIAGTFLDDVQVDFLVRATQADRRGITLTAPRLTITNGQFSNIYIMTQRAYVSDLQPVTAESAVGFDPTVDVVSEGFTMSVEGIVSADRRYVTMNIDAGISKVDGFAQQAVSAVAGGQLINSADTQSFIQLPTITVTRVRTTATVPDQGTMLLGGQRLINEWQVEAGVPVLSKLPVLNRFFSNRIETKDERTLMVLVKPTILIQHEAEDEQFPGLRDQLGTGLGL